MRVLRDLSDEQLPIGVISVNEGKYENIVTVAAVNWTGVWGDKSANLAKIKEVSVEAANAGVNIIAFPELALSGYECSAEIRSEKKPCKMHTDAAETIPGPATEELADLAKKQGIYILFGMPEQDPENAYFHYNTVAIVGPEGIVGKCRKINLSMPPIWTEKMCFAPGNNLPVFETSYGPIGVLVCKDFWKVPELTRILYLKGARIVFNIAASPSGRGGSDLMKYITCSRASENIIYIVSCNHVGKEMNASYYGCSTIAGPSYPRMAKIIAQGSRDYEEVVTATLNLNLLQQWDKKASPKDEINWDIVVKEYNKLLFKNTLKETTK